MIAARDTDAGPESDDPLAWRQLAKTPLLGMLAAFAALLDLAVNRVAIRTLGETLSHLELIELVRWGHLPRNLAAISGLVALTIALLSFLRTPMHAPVRRRLSIAGFAGIFLPTTALATLLPAERTSLQIVLFAVGAANVLAVLLGLTAARRDAPWGIRAGVALVAISAFFAFASLVVTLLPPIAQTQAGLVAGAVLRRTGEVCFLIAPIAVAVSIGPRGRDRRSRVSLAAGVVTFLVAMSLSWWGLNSLRGDFAVVLYGAERVELFLESAPFVYVVLLSTAVAVGVAGVTSGDSAHRQAGAGVLLLVAGGYAARSPGRLLMTVLAVALLARTCIVLGERVLLLREERKQPADEVPTASPEDAQEA
jgi:hypothetical protein